MAKRTGKKSKSVGQKVKKAVKAGIRKTANKINTTLAQMAVTLVYLANSKVMPLDCKFKILGDSMIGLDRATAIKFSQFQELFINGSKLDRGIKTAVTERYGQCMLVGRFIWQKVCLVTAVYNGIERRINGQNTVGGRLLIEDATTAPMVRWVRYKVESEKELRELYSLIDECMVKSTMDVVRALLVGTPEYSKVTLDELKRIHAALNLFLNPARQGKKAAKGKGLTKQDRAELMLTTYFNTVKTVLSVYGLDHPFLTWRAPVVAALLAIFSNPKYATNGRAFRFWCDVVHNNGLLHNSAGWLLHEYLVTHGVRGDRVKSNNQVHPEIMYQVCLKYFIAYMDGGPLENIEQSCCNSSDGRPVL